MDAEIARKVFGCNVVRTDILLNPGIKVFARRDDELQEDTPKSYRTLYSCQCTPWHIHQGDDGTLPHYSTDIADAWAVVEKVKTIPTNDRYATSEGFQVRALNDGSYMAGWACGEGAHEDERFLWIVETASTPAHAICLAALRAVGVTVK